MYPQPGATADAQPFNFLSEEYSQWKGLFVDALHTVQRQVHPSLTAKDESLAYIENLILQLLGMLCACHPHSVQDVEDRVLKTFPQAIVKWATTDAQNALDKGKKKSSLQTLLVLPVEKIHPLLKEVLGYKIDHQVTVYLVAVLEYIAADILKLTGNYVRNIKHKEITLQDIKVAMNADKVVMDMFFQDDEDQFTGVEEESVFVRSESVRYEDIVKDLVLEENQYLRDLLMIIKLFREPFATLYPGDPDLENIFSNIEDIHELTYNFLSSLEDMREMNEDSGEALIGTCFEDIAEGAEFDVYFKYTEDELNPFSRERLNALLDKVDVDDKLKRSGHGFKDAVRYVLPKLMLGPIFHCLYYFDVLLRLKKASPDEDDQESLQNAYSVMHQLKVDIEKKLNNANLLKRKPSDFITLRFQGRAEKEVALNKMNELQRQIDGWEGKNIGQSCHEFIMEGTLTKSTGRRLTSERYVFLFDGLIIFTKQNPRGRSSVTGSSTGEYKLKEKYNMRRIDVADREDTDELKYSFELLVRDHPNIILGAKTYEEKCNWMAALISLLRRSMLERMLDTRISEETKQQPLKLPSADVYKFAEEDSEENIVFEDNRGPSGKDTPVIKGGTLVKLVERLTYHMYAEPTFVRTFLTTYRTFCNSVNLLEALINRFEIPEPQPVREGDDATDPSLFTRDDIKRFRKIYAKPVQFRVLNVLRHWVDQHWCDFDWNSELLNMLEEFLDSVKGKAMRKWVESIQKVINRKKESDGYEVPKQITFAQEKPLIEWHIARNPDDFELMKLHPIEIARQVTLLEFDLYRAVKPSELVGSVWMKKKKNVTSPNLLKMINHSTRFTFWLEKCIIETENFEERTMVVSRILEIMMVFQELNNFNGILEVVGALNSAPVHRLEHTFEEVNQKHHKLMKAFDEAKDLSQDHFKKYYEKLRSINPPCVPFLGNYLTNILLTEEGNPDFLPNRPEGIINFSKRRKVAAICGEIQQYQNQPYCLRVEGSIRTFFEDLNPLNLMNEKEFNDYLYGKSLEIEPRQARQPAKFEKKYPFSLKSPGIKPSGRGTLKHERGTHLSNTSSTLKLPGLSEEDDLVSLASQTPPPSPGTPITPDYAGSGNTTSSDQTSSVFALVQLPDTQSLGGLNSGMSGMSLTSPPVLQSSSSSPLLPPARDDIPPPLPPRRKRESSSGCELSPIRTPHPSSFMAFAKEGIGPHHPPHPSHQQQLPHHPQQPFTAFTEDNSDIPPPLPPRLRDRGGSLEGANPFHLQGNMTLPRSFRMPQHPGSIHTLPRRNSERDTLGSTSTGPPQFVNMNGNRGVSMTPQLPPKTYNRSVVHSRQQSS